MQTLLKLLGLIRGHRLFLGVGISFALAYTLLALVPPLFIRIVLQDIITGQNTPNTNMVQSIALLAGGIVGIALLRGLSRYCDAIISHIVAYRILDQLLMRVYAHLQQMPHQFFANERTGALATRAVSDVEAIEVFVAHVIAQFVQAVLIPVAMVAVLFVINPWLAVLTVVPLPIVVVVSGFFAPRFAQLWRSVRHQLAEIGATFHEDLGGIPVIKAFTRERERQAHLARQSARFRDEIIYANKWTLVPMSLIETIGGISAALILWQGGIGALRGQISAADLMVFILYSGYIYQPILQLSALGEGMNQAFASADRVFELLETPPDIVDSPTAFVPSRIEPRVEFDGVSFSYDPERPVLRDFGLTIAAGETVALVGITGAGKTTAVNLIPRFYDVQYGALLVGGHDVRDVQIEWLRSKVAMVLQDVFLFEGTIRDNLLFGRPGATEREMIDAARAANAEEFICQLPRGYETLVGERGVRLSGGQKQRLSIARAILRDAPILILDEPTSAVDVETEGLIQDALARLAVGRTTIVIAHRLSTIRTADRIAVLDRGQVAEIGDHEDLMARRGIYAHLYDVQTARQAWTFRAAVETS